MTTTHFYPTRDISVPPGYVALPVVYLAERVNGWWPGVTQICPVPACGGRMVIRPPDTTDGELYCILCARTTHTIVERRKAALVRGDLRATRGRPRKPAVADPPPRTPHARRRGHSAPQQLLDYLRSGAPPTPAYELAEQWGYTPQTIRNAARHLNLRGLCVVMCIDGCYRLKGTRS